MARICCLPSSPWEAAVEAEGEQRLLDLALDLAFGVGHVLRVEQPHPDQLLAHRRRARHRLAGLEVLEEGAHDAAQVHARVGPERLVLGSHLGVDHHRRDLVEVDGAPILDRERGQLHAVRGVHRRALGQVEVLDSVERRQVRGVRGVDRHHPEEQGNRRDPEEAEDDARQRGGARTATRPLRGRPTPGRRRSAGHRAAG